MKRTSIMVATILRIWCVVALFMVGFAHAPLMATPVGPAELSAYALPDGSLPDLCVGERFMPGDSKMLSKGCDACRLSAAVLLPTPTTFATRLVLSLPLSLEAARTDRVVLRIIPANARPRAPPVSVIMI